MKRILIYCLGLVFMLSCKTDSFSDTTRYFITDKDTCSVSDSFELSVIIAPLGKEKTIRFYKTFSNLKIYFSLINKQKGAYSKNSIQLKKNL